MCPICSTNIALSQAQKAADDAIAAGNRESLDRYGVLAINLSCSTEASKAALLDATIVACGHGYRIAVIECARDGEHATPRIRRRGMAAVQVKAVGSCHLHAGIVGSALQELPLSGVDLLFIGNVGSLTGSAKQNLGQHRNVTVLSSIDSGHTREEFHQILRATDLTLLSKADLLEVAADLGADQAAVALRMLGRRTPMIQSVALRARSLAPWLQWLEKQLRSRRTARPLIRASSAAERAHQVRAAPAAANVLDQRPSMSLGESICVP